MSFHQPYIESPLKISSMKLPMKSNNKIINQNHNARPTSDPSFNLIGNNNKNFLVQQQQTKNSYLKSMIYENRDIRGSTFSDVIGNNPNNTYFNNNIYKSSEAEQIDKMFEDLSHYERTLEEMANTKLNDDFKEEMSAIEQWFNVLSECERTTVLYSLIQNISTLQVRFLITLLQQKIKGNPLLNSTIVRKSLTDSVNSSSTKHCSNASSEASSASAVNSTSDTCFEDEEYQQTNSPFTHNSYHSSFHSQISLDLDRNNMTQEQNSFIEQRKNSSNSQFSCPLNINEYNMAMNVLSNANLLNERSSSLSPKQRSTQSQSTQQSQSQSQRKNSYINTMMNEYSFGNPPLQNNSNINVLRDLNRFNELNSSSIGINPIQSNTSTNSSMINPQYMSSNKQNLMVNLSGASNEAANNYSIGDVNSSPILQNIQLLNNNNLNSGINRVMDHQSHMIINPLNSSAIMLNSNSTPNSTANSAIMSSTANNNSSLVNSTLNLNNKNDSPINEKYKSSNVGPIGPPTQKMTMNNNENNICSLLSKSKVDNSTQSSSILQNIKSSDRIKCFLNNKVSKEVELGSLKSSNIDDSFIFVDSSEEDLNKKKNISKQNDQENEINKTKNKIDDIKENNEENKKELVKKDEKEENKKQTKENIVTTPTPSGESIVATVSSGREKGKIPDQIDLELVKNFPTFLRSLRLHKYSPSFEDLTWKQAVKLDNEQLLKRGVAALGARNKMLKVFDMIKEEANKQKISLDD